MKNNLEIYFQNQQELRDKVKQQNKKEIRRIAQLVFNKGRINAYQFYAILSKNQWLTLAKKPKLTANG